MNTHSLLESEFGDIARGAGDENAIDQLRGGQFSKHVLLLLGILNQAREACPEIYPQLDDAYSLLRTAQEKDRGAVNEFLSHPHVGLWAARCLRRLRGELDDDPSPLTADLSQLGAIAAVAAIRAGCSFTTTVSLRNGVAALPTLGVAKFPGADPWARATLTYDGRQVRVCVDGQTVLPPNDLLGDGPCWFGVRRLRSDHEGQSVEVELADVAASIDGSESGLASRTTDSELARWRERFDEAWRTIVRHHPAHAAALGVGLVSIVPMDRLTGSFASMSTSDAFGTVMTKLPEDGLLLAETLIHEFHHSKLNALMDLVPLHDADEEAKYYAPWRPDPRPLRGLLHGTYAFLGVTDFWRVQREALRGPQKQFADFTFARWREQVTTAVEVLLHSGYLTSRGSQFVSSMRSVTQGWRDAEVEALPRRMANQTTAEHRIRWRLRYLRPEPESITALADAWRAGTPCPVAVGWVPVEVVPGPVPRSDSVLSALMRLRIRRPDRFTALCADPGPLIAAGLDVIDADIRYLRDDFPAAIERYRTEVEAHADNMNRWVGLTLASVSTAGEHRDALLTAPEVVRAVYLRLLAGDGAAPRLSELLGWLDSAAGPVTAEGAAAAGPLDVLKN